VPTLTALQLRKFTALFRHQDQCNNDFLTQQDFLLIADALSRALGWQQQDPDTYHLRHAALEEHLQKFFLRLQSQSDSNQDGQVSLAEYLAYMKRQVAECRAMGMAAPWVKESTRQILLLLDQHASNSLTVDEYAKILQALGSDADAGQAFAKMDVTGKGELTAADLDRLALEFVVSDDPQAPGNLLYLGKIE
jgi:hypothetical protein